MTERAPVRWSEPEGYRDVWTTEGFFETRSGGEVEVRLDMWEDGTLTLTGFIPPGYTLRDCLEGEDLLRKAAQT